MVGDLDVALRVRADTTRAAREIRRLRTGVDRLGTAASPRGAQRARGLGLAWERASVGIGRARRAATGLRGAITGIATAVAVVAIARVGLEFERLERRMRFATGSAEAGRREMEFVRAEADRLGLDLLAAADGYSAFAAATRGTALEGQAARDIFTAVAEASAVLGLRADDTRGVLTALEQIVSKGTVSAEELRGQLGERLPGAFLIAARSIGVTTERLDEMLRNGELAANDLLPALARQLRQEFGGSVEDATGAADASFRRFNNALAETGNVIYRSGLRDALQGLAVAGTNFLNVIQSLVREAAEFLDLVDSPADRVDEFVRTGSGLTGEDLRGNPRLAEAAQAQQQALNDIVAQRDAEIERLLDAISSLGADIGQREASLRAEQADIAAANRAALDGITLGIEEGIRRAGGGEEREELTALQQELARLNEAVEQQLQARDEERSLAERLDTLVQQSVGPPAPAGLGAPTRASPTPAAGGTDDDADTRAAERAATELERITARAEDRRARLTLDRIAQVEREERMALDRVNELEQAGLVATADAEQARTSIRLAALAERSRIRNDELDDLQADLDKSLEAEEERQRKAAEAAAEAHAAAVDAIEGREVDLGIVDEYQAAVTEARRWRDGTLAALDETGAGYEELRERVEDVYRAMLVAARDSVAEQEQAAASFGDGVEAGLERVAEGSQDLAGVAERATVGAFKNMEDALVNFVRTGELSFASLVDAIIADLARLAIQQAITGPLAAALFGAFATPTSPAGGAAPAVPAGTSLFGGVAHGGAIAGQLGGRRRLVPPGIFAGARRYHAGGLAGDEVPVITRRGEGIFTPEQMRALGPAAPPRIDISFVNQGTPQRETGRRIEINPEAVVAEIFINDLDRRGPISQRLERETGAGRRVA